MSCFRSAALPPASFAPAQYALGYCYRSSGRGVHSGPSSSSGGGGGGGGVGGGGVGGGAAGGGDRRDLPKSAAFFRAAAEQGHAAAQFSLGKLCEYFEDEKLHEVVLSVPSAPSASGVPAGGGGSGGSAGRWDFFISHTQRNPEAKLLALDLHHTLQERGFSAWLDVKMEDMNTAAMKAGVFGSQAVIAVVTGPCPSIDGSGGGGGGGGGTGIGKAAAAGSANDRENAYFSRWMCCQELDWAEAAGVPVIPVVRAEDKKRIGEFVRAAPEDGDVHPRCRELKRAV